MVNLRKRIIRDIAAVVVFCGLFFGLILSINFFQRDSKDESATDFSEYRVNADLANQDKDYDLALVNLEAMVARDAYDGRARYLLATTRYKLYRELNSQVEEKEALAAAGDARERANLAPLLDRRTQVIETLVTEFESAAEHPRYSDYCGFYLAVLYTAKEEYDVAIKHLRQFVNSGLYTPRGLYRVRGLMALREHPEFHQVAVRESSIREGYFGETGYLAGPTRSRPGQDQRQTENSSRDPVYNYITFGKFLQSPVTQTFAFMENIQTWIKEVLRELLALDERLKPYW